MILNLNPRPAEPKARAAATLSPEVPAPSLKPELIAQRLESIMQGLSFPFVPTPNGSSLGLWVTQVDADGKESLLQSTALDPRASLGIQDLMASRRKVLSLPRLVTALENAPASGQVGNTGLVSFDQVARRTVLRCDAPATFAGIRMDLRIIDNLKSAVNPQIGVYRFGLRGSSVPNPIEAADTYSEGLWSVRIPPGCFGVNLYIIPPWNAFAPFVVPSQANDTLLTNSAAYTQGTSTDMYPMWEHFGGLTDPRPTRVLVNFTIGDLNRAITMRTPDLPWVSYASAGTVSAATAVTEAIAAFTPTYGGIFNFADLGGGVLEITGLYGFEDVAMRMVTGASLSPDSVVASMTPNLADLTGAYSGMGLYPVGNRVVTVTPTQNFRSTLNYLTFNDLESHALLENLYALHKKYATPAIS